MDMNHFRTGYLNAESLAKDVSVEAVITNVETVVFEDTDQTKPVVRFDGVLPVILNQTRLRELIGAFGPNSQNWLGRTIIISRGKTKYQGRDVDCVELKAVVADRIAAASPRPQLVAQPKRGSADIRSGRNAWRDEPPPAPPPTELPEDPDDIPF